MQIFNYFYKFWYYAVRTNNEPHEFLGIKKIKIIVMKNSGEKDDLTSWMLDVG